MNKNILEEENGRNRWKINGKFKNI